MQSNYSCILLEPLSSIGLTANLVVVSGVVKMQSVPALHYPSPLQLQSGVLCSGGCLDSAGPLVGGYIPMCATIPINMTPSGFWISWQKTSESYFTEFYNPVSIRLIDIKITDTFGNTCQLPGTNHHCDIVFRIWY